MATRKRKKSPPVEFDYQGALEDLGFPDVTFEPVGDGKVFRVTSPEEPDDPKFISAAAFRKHLGRLLRNDSDTDDEASWWEKFWCDMPTCKPPDDG